MYIVNEQTLPMCLYRKKTWADSSTTGGKLKNTQLKQMYIHIVLKNKNNSEK